MVDVMVLIAAVIVGLCIGIPIGCALALKRGPAFASGVVDGFTRPWLVFRKEKR